MNWRFSPFAVPLYVSAAIMLGVAVLAWQRRLTKGALCLVVLSVGAVIYSLGYAFEISSLTLPAVYLWLRIEYLGIILPPVMLVIIALIYTGKERLLTPLNIAILFAIPAITLVFAWINEYHELIWQNITLDTSGVFTRTLFRPGGWYWVHAGYTYFLMLSGGGMLLLEYFQARQIYRRQIGFIMLGALVPLITSFVYYAGLAPEGLDINPYGFPLIGITVAWGMFEYRLFSFAPMTCEVILAGMHDAVIVQDKLNQVVNVNPAALQLLGVESGQIIGQPVSQFLEPWADALTGDGLHETRARLSSEIGGKLRHFDAWVSPLYGTKKRLEGRLVVLRDITERIEAENALKRSNKRLETLRMLDAELSRKLDVQYVYTLALDAAMRLSLADAAFISVIEDEHIRIVSALGHFPHDRVAKLLPKEEGITARVIRSRQAELVQDVSSDPDYVEIIETTRSMITASLISGTKLIGVLTLECSHPERFTPEVFESTKLLAARIAVAIDNANVYEEREKLVEELDAFAHTVAHDLKNPLSGIIGHSDLLYRYFDKLPEDEIKEGLQLMYQAADKANQIINALMLLAGLRMAGTVEITTLDMDAVVRDVCTRLDDQIQEWEAKITFPDTWHQALGFRPWVEEIWANYLSNAIKYGGRPPRIELGSDQLKDGQIRFWVRDNGAGLSKENQRKLFRPFTRLNPTSAAGHGLGLSIVQRITERLKGRVGVESEPDHGSLFYFTLPPVSPD